MTNRFRRAAIASALVLSTIGLAASPAAADWRYGHRYRGGDVAAGVLGGLAIGAIAGSALARPLPPPPVYYRPAPAYVYEAPPPVTCYWTRQQVWIDRYTYQVRRVRVCE